MAFFFCFPLWLLIDIYFCFFFQITTSVKELSSCKILLYIYYWRKLFQGRIDLNENAIVEDYAEIMVYNVCGQLHVT